MVARRRKEAPPSREKTGLPREALNDPADIPPGLDRWNWGAFFLNWIWGIGNSTFVALLALIPIVNIIMLFVLGWNGSRWAWRNRAWRDAEHFRRSQRAWAIAGLAIWVVAIGGVAATVGSVPILMRSSGAYHATLAAALGDQRIKAALGENVRANWWFGGHVSVNGDGSGVADLTIPVHGDRGSGTIVSHALKAGGRWSIRLLFVRVKGMSAPIVLINADDLAIPNASMGI